MKRFLIILSLVLLIQVVHAQDFSVGVSPLLIQLDNLDKGSKTVIKFNLITHSTIPFSVDLEPEDARIDFFSKPAYSNLGYNYSEESTASWAKILENPVSIEAVEDVNKRNTKEVSFLLPHLCSVH